MRGVRGWPKVGLLGITGFVVCLPDMYYVSLGTVSPLRARPISSTEIAIANQVKRDEKKIIPDHYLDHREVFEKEMFDELPKRGPWDHAIELVPGAKPVDCKIYPLN